MFTASFQKHLIEIKLFKVREKLYVYKRQT